MPMLVLSLSAVRDPDIARTLLDQREAVRCLAALLPAAVCLYVQHAFINKRTLQHFACVHCRAEAQGKTLLLITNSDFNYTDKLMRYSFDPYLPEGFSWRDLFDMVRHDPAYLVVCRPLHLRLNIN